MNIKKGDNVIVIAGKDKGKKGKVEHVNPSKKMVVIDGVNLKKKRTRPKKQGDKGLTFEVTSPIHISNVQLFESGAKKGVRCGFSIEKGKKVRISKATGKAI
jgi:large subunit ribosomal protein L24